MNVADLELSKTLYKLSEWGDTDYHHIRVDGRHARVMRSPQNTAKVKYRFPAYDLGYLLRKLPNYIPTYGDDGDDYLFSLKPNFEGNEWGAAYWGLQKALHWNVAVSPEDAVCKLAIELFKQGILTKGAPYEK